MSFEGKPRNLKLRRNTNRNPPLSIVSGLHWRSTSASAHVSQSRDFFELQSTYLSQSSLQFNLYPQIISPHSAAITSLDIDNTCEGRFLLAGSQDCTISVYDLSLLGSDYHLNTNTDGEQGNGNGDTTSSTCCYTRVREQERIWKEKNRFQPVARSRRNFSIEAVLEQHRDPLHVPPGHSHSVTRVQWYPVDTGVFLSGDKGGNILLWDTNTFTPISCVRKTVMDDQSMSIASIDFPKLDNSSHLLLAIGSIQSSNGNHNSMQREGHGGRILGESGSGTSSGQLIIDDRVVYLCDVKSGSMTHQLVGHGMGGIPVVQWSPIHEYVLASGSRDGTIKLWDIRKSGSGACLLTLDRENKTKNEIYFGTSTCTSTMEDAGRGGISIRTRTKKRRKKSKKFKMSVVGPSDYSSIECSSYIQSHAGPVASLSFTPDGNHIMSASPSDGLKLWDVQPGTDCGKLLDTRFIGNSTSSVSAAHIHTNPLDPMQHLVPLCITQPASFQSATVWVGGRNHKLLGYNVHGDGGKPNKVLAGHLDHVTAIESQNHSMRIFTGGRDGMILGFGHKNEFEFCPS